METEKEKILYWYYVIKKLYPDIEKHKDVEEKHLFLLNYYRSEYGEQIDEDPDLARLFELMLRVPRTHYSSDYRDHLADIGLSKVLYDEFYISVFIC